MRRTNHSLFSGVHAFCWVASLTTTTLALDRGTLLVNTLPDSAIVVLDHSKDAERQKTPLCNESMIPGKHSVLVRPSNPAFKSASYEVDIQPGQTTTIEHTFEYRTKSFGMEHLSIAPWVVEFGLGLEALRYLGMAPEIGADASAEAVSAPSTYPADSIPTSLYFPIQLRLGLPGGWEGHVQFPLGKVTAPKTKRTSEGFHLSDPGVGIKWVYSPLNTGLDLSWTFGSNEHQNLGTKADALILTAITNQKWSLFDLAANLGFALRLERLDDPNVQVGNRLFAKVRGGMLLADQFLPLVQAGLQVTTPDVKSGSTDSSGHANAQLTLTPGFIFYANQNLSLELGVPLTLLASNAETSWGGQVSLAWDFSLEPKKKTENLAKTAVLSAYPLQNAGVPLSSGIHILFDSKEITNLEYKAFCDKTGREYPADPEFTGMPGYFTDPKTANYPVVKISLDDARAYAAWVGKRLPTVTEWRKEIETAPLSSNLVACGLEAPEPVGSRHQGSGLYNMVGNVAEWVENDRNVGSVAYIAGGFFSLPRERCLDKGRWIDVASPAGARYIGMRLVSEVK